MKHQLIDTKTSGKEICRRISSFNLIFLMWVFCFPILPATSVNAQVSADIWKMKESRSLSSFKSKISDGKVSPGLKELVRLRSAKNGQIPNYARSSQPEDEYSSYIFANVEFTSAKARADVFPSNESSRIEGISALTVIDRFADVFIDMGAGDGKAELEALRRSPGVLRVEDTDEIEVPTPLPSQVSKTPSRAIPDPIVRGGFKGLKGKDVIIAIVDSGIDFRHPDFITDGSDSKPISRLLYLWDPELPYEAGRGSPAPYRFPNGTPIGTLFTRDQLTNELRSSDRSIPEIDLGGHGTACAGIAAGNGNADFKKPGGLKRPEVVGVAPEADIIGIVGFPSIYLFNAMNEWLDKVAGSKPLVVSNSWGLPENGRDGQTVFERQLDARYPLDRKGRAILFAAGNEGEDEFHATIQFSGQKETQVIWYAGSIPSFTVYFDTNDIDDIVFGEIGETYIEPYEAYVNPLTDQVVASFDTNFGIGGAFFRSRTGKLVKADLYFASLDSSFHKAVSNRQGMLRWPGTMRNSITVGSYDWNDNFRAVKGAVTVLPTLACKTQYAPMTIGSISCYSSPGPTRDGRVKPEIAAPGQWFSASHAKWEGGYPLDPGAADVTGDYYLMNGTSAATPYAAGIVALMFEKKPNLTLGEVRTLLQTNASKDPFTGIPPGTAWGSGKLDMKAVERIFAAIR